MPEASLEQHLDTRRLPESRYCEVQLVVYRCQDSSMVRFLRVDPTVNGSSRTSAKLSLKVRRVASSL